MWGAQDAEEAYQERMQELQTCYRKQLSEYRARERDVVAAYNAALQQYNSQLYSAKTKYHQGKSGFLTRQKAHNQTVQALRDGYKTGSPDAIEQYVRMILEKSSYPDGIDGDPEVHFDLPSKTLVVNFRLPRLADLPKILEYKFIASRKEIKPLEMKQKDFEAFYDDVIHQLALRTIHEVFRAELLHVEAVVFNGWVQGMDAKTGKSFNSCVLSCQAARQQFKELGLAHVSPKECVRGLKGITAGPLAMLAPVIPIMELKRDDNRFVESKAVLGQLNPKDNLAAMDWEDFEHLVRELFEKEFGKSGGEVRVTQASRDRGVDAIAFDPDPIRGGKYVIQAKRYNTVVPVSAVRDLYGTMIAEGAVKGILVTTSHFGSDTREFAKDKPVSLIDGSHLVHLFQKHGHVLHIAVLPKGDPRRGPFRMGEDA